MPRTYRKGPKWWDQRDIRAYAVERYAGKASKARAFTWLDAQGKLHKGNSTAFVNHMAEKFGFVTVPSDHVRLNRILLLAGLRVNEGSPRKKHNRASNGDGVVMPAREFHDMDFYGTRHHSEKKPRNTEGRWVKGKLVQGEDGIWREQEG